MAAPTAIEVRDPPFAECLRDELRGEAIDVCRSCRIDRHASVPTRGQLRRPPDHAVVPRDPPGAGRGGDHPLRQAAAPRRDHRFSGRQFVVLRDLALPLFGRVMSRNVERETSCSDRPKNPPAT
jgi:hypothetical protein